MLLTKSLLLYWNLLVFIVQWLKLLWIDNHLVIWVSLYKKRVKLLSVGFIMIIKFVVKYEIYSADFIYFLIQLHVNHFLSSSILYLCLWCMYTYLAQPSYRHLELFQSNTDQKFLCGFCLLYMMPFFLSALQKITDNYFFITRMVLIILLHFKTCDFMTINDWYVLDFNIWFELFKNA